MCQPINKFKINPSGSASYSKIDTLISIIEEIKVTSHESYVLILEMFTDCPTTELFLSTGIQRLRLVFAYNVQLRNKEEYMIELINEALSDPRGDAQGQLFEWITEEYGGQYGRKTYGHSFSMYRKALFWDEICNEAVDVNPEKGSRNLDLVISADDTKVFLGIEVKTAIQNFLTNKPRASVLNKVRYMQLLCEVFQSVQGAIYLVSARTFITEKAQQQLKKLGGYNIKVATIRSLLAN